MGKKSRVSLLGRVLNFGWNRFEWPKNGLNLNFNQNRWPENGQPKFFAFPIRKSSHNTIYRLPLQMHQTLNSSGHFYFILGDRVKNCVEVGIMTDVFRIATLLCRQSWDSPHLCVIDTLLCFTIAIPRRPPLVSGCVRQDCQHIGQLTDGHCPLMHWTIVHGNC